MLKRRSTEGIDNSRILLIAQMQRVIEVLEKQDVSKLRNSQDLAELENKLHEIRRDSIRFMRIARNPYEFKKEYS